MLPFSRSVARASADETDVKRETALEDGECTNASGAACEENPSFSSPDDENPSFEADDSENPNFECDDNPSFEENPNFEDNPSFEMAVDLEQGVAAQAAGEAPAVPSRLLPLLCGAISLEGSQTMLLPSMYRALQGDLHLSLSNLAAITLMQALCQSLASPVWGILADRGVLRRKTILVLGCLVQGCVTLALAAVSNFPLLLIMRGLTGAMLGTLKPTSNGIVADVTSERCRGKAFGWLELSIKTGMVVSTLVGTPLSTRSLLGVQGFRVAFLGVGLWSLVVGLALAWLLQEPPTRLSQAKTDGTICGALCAEASKLGRYLRRPTFFILVAQGNFGCIPWNALGYMTLFFQVGGMSDVAASVLQACCQCSQAVGCLLGGIIGDRLAGRWRMHGRPITAQVSVLAGVPVAWMIFMVPPPQSSSGAFAWYLALVVVLGLTGTWCATGVNWPVLSEIVEPEGRGTVMAWQTALEGSCAAVLGNAAVGFLAQSVFGYDLASAKGSGAADPANMRALGQALLLTSFVPWIICFVFYSLLHWTYPRDLARERARAGQAKGAAAAAVAEVPKAKEIQEPGSPGSPGRPRISEAAAKASTITAI